MRLLGAALVRSNKSIFDMESIHPAGDLDICVPASPPSPGFAFDVFCRSSSSRRILSSRDSTPATACWKKAPTPHLDFCACELCAMVADALEKSLAMTRH